MVVSKSRGAVVVVFLSVFLAMQGCGKTQSESAVSGVDIAGTTGQELGSKQNIGAKPFEAGPFRVFNVYTDANAPDNHYTASGWMGDYADLLMDEKNLSTAHSGTTSIKITYGNKATQGARWVGVYWQNPPNNWGTRPGGYDLRGAKKLTFWARGESGGERIEEVKMGGITGEYADSDVAGIGPLALTTEWRQYTIDLEGKDLASISGGFSWATNLDANPNGCTFYLDDIRYE